MLRMYALIATGLVFAVGLYMTLRNWRLRQRFRDEGLAIMALSALAFLVASRVL